MLGGQKLQGVCTAKEVHEFLKARGKVAEYPLFTVVVRSCQAGLVVTFADPRSQYRIAYEGIKPDQLTAHI